MTTIDELRTLSAEQGIPVEDLVFIALNFSGVKMDVAYNRMRMGFRLNAADSTFAYAKALDDLDYYFALPINHHSPFEIVDGELRLSGYLVGYPIGPTEDYCDSHYPRRMGTSLNINPNSRTSCRGCNFCYTAYQIPYDKVRMRNEEDIRGFLARWMREHQVDDLSGLIQVSVVTGCYDSEADLVSFLLTLDSVLQDLGFTGRIFYLGSMLTSSSAIESLSAIPAFGYCVSLECFERRGILKDSKSSLTLKRVKEIMHECVSLGMEVNYTHVLGTEPLSVVVPRMQEFMECTTKFPTINILQLHQQHPRELLDPTVSGLQYFLDARTAIEDVFMTSSMRPLVWEDYRSLWYLRFKDEVLTGCRVPERWPRCVSPDVAGDAMAV